MSNDTILPYVRLRHHLDVPTLEDTWLDGYESAGHSVGEQANPYEENTSEYHHWNEGWWAGFYGDEPLFSLSGEVNEKAIYSTHIASKLQVRAAANQGLMPKLGFKINGIVKILTTILASLVIYELADVLLTF